jgi:hypothetical protein
MITFICDYDETNRSSEHSQMRKTFVCDWMTLGNLEPGKKVCKKRGNKEKKKGPA